MYDMHCYFTLTVIFKKPFMQPYQKKVGISQPCCFSIRVSGNPSKNDSVIGNPQKTVLDLMQLLQKWSELSNLYKKIRVKGNPNFLSKSGLLQPIQRWIRHRSNPLNFLQVGFRATLRLDLRELIQNHQLS